MKTMLFGYKISKGKAYVDKVQANRLQKLYEGYISGLSIKAAALEAGIDSFHGYIGRMLKNKKYLGTDFYPAIISEDIFQKAQEERENRAKKLGRVRETEKDLPILAPTKFHMKSSEIAFEDPFRQAEFAYSMIESEWF